MLSFNKNKIKVLLLEGVHSKAEEIFALHGYNNIDVCKTALPPDELATRLKDVFLLGIRSRSQITTEVLRKGKRLIAIGCFCIGTNQVDNEAAAWAGIPVFNAPHSNTRSVAELTIGFTIMLLRHMQEKSFAAHRGHWLKSAKGAREVRGKVMGIVGYGHIGSQVSILAEALGMHVIYYDILSKLPLGNAKAVESLETLLETADVVSLHVPGGEKTRGLIGREQLALMKKDACLVNVSRGSVVDVKALEEALDDERLAGAALDVFPQEPASNDEPFDCGLIGRDNVVLSPHVGGSTQEAQQNIGINVAKKLVYFSDRGSTEGAVNFPQVCLAQNVGSHRILHIHKNIPGMLQQINTIIADKRINVLGQYLLTNPQIGYAVIDIALDGSDSILHSLKSIEGTIRSRILY